MHILGIILNIDLKSLPTIESHVHSVWLVKVKIAVSTFQPFQRS